MNNLAGIHILLVLLPGFLTAQIVSFLTVTSQRSELDKVIEALVYSFIIYAACVLILGFPALGILTVEVPADAAVLQNSLASAKWNIALTLAMSIVLGLAVSWLVTNDWLTSVLRKFGVTARSSRASVWSDVFHTVDGYALIEFTDGRRLRGWPQHFSDTPEEASLFLTQAAWILDDGAPVEIEGPGVLITKSFPIQTISFLAPIPKTAAEMKRD